ncbi:MAG: hypothetical protein KBD01_11095 [Acidobacteria bacterium]|nr:hypothetical protein [Acidobacteriota bacterium]
MLRHLRSVLHRFAAASAALTALAPGAPAQEPPAGRPPAPPQPTDIVERAEVKLVQVDISVIDPKKNTAASVPGLPLDAFDIRLDGKKLTDAQRALLKLDRICDAAGPDGAPPPAPPPGIGRPVIAVVDFNYVDAAGREKVAQAIEGLAGEAAARPETYKFYGLTRQLRSFHAGFTRDAAEIRQIAQLVRRTIWRGEEPAELVLPQNPAAALLGSSGALPMQDAIAAETSLPNVSSATPRYESGSYSPQASLAALEGVLRAHSGIAGRKVVLWFSSSKFIFVPALKDRMEPALARIVDVAQPGYAIWTIDTAGLEGSGTSPVLSALAGDTGGQGVRMSGQFAGTFRGAAEQLSCYYLFSLPVEVTGGSARRTLTVKLDTDRYRELWGLRVLAPGAVQVVDEATRGRDRRLAALLSPDDFARPAVAATIDYPALTQKGALLPVRFRVPLTELNWLPLPGGGVQARLLVDGVVQHDTGTFADTACEFGAEKFGEIALRMEAPPANPHAGFTVEVPCAYGKDGLYVARGVITDLEAAESGAGRSTVALRRGGADRWAALALRVEANSGRDLLWRPGAGAARRDTSRSGFRVVGDAQPADPGERVALSYVLCGPARSQAREKVQHLLIARDADGTPRLVRSLPGSALALVDDAGDERFCSQARIAIPEYSLDYGRYAFAVVESGTPVETALARVAAPAPPAETGGVLAVATFTIASP